MIKNMPFVRSGIVFCTLIFSLAFSHVFAQEIREEEFSSQKVEKRLERAKKILGYVEKTLSKAKSVTKKDSDQVNKLLDLIDSVKSVLDDVQSTAKESHDVRWKIKTDPENNAWTITATEDAAPGSPRSRYFLERKDATSKFGGFYEPAGSVLSAQILCDLNEKEADKLKKMFEKQFGAGFYTSPEPAPIVLSNSDAPVLEEGSGLFKRAISPDESNRPGLESRELTAKEIRLNETTWLFHEAVLKLLESGKIDAAFTFGSDRTLIGGLEYPDTEEILDAKKFFFDLLERTSKEPGSDFQYTSEKPEPFEDFLLFSITFSTMDSLRSVFGDNEVLDWIHKTRIFGEGETELIFGFRENTCCFALGPAGTVAPKLRMAIREMRTPQPVPRTFCVFSAFELRKLFSETALENDQIILRSLATDLEEGVRLKASCDYSETERKLEISIHGKMVPVIMELMDYKITDLPLKILK